MTTAEARYVLAHRHEYTAETVAYAQEIVDRSTN